MIRSYFDKHFQEYDEWYDMHGDIYEFELSILKKYKKYITERSLEIGVGSGRFAQPLGIKYGIDISPNLLKIASERGIICKKESGSDTSFKKDQFDFIGIFFSLSFIADIKGLFTEIDRILNKKGKLLTLFINRNRKIPMSSAKQSSFYKGATFYTPNEVIDLFNNIKILEKIDIDIKKMKTDVKNSDIVLILGGKK